MPVGRSWRRSGRGQVERTVGFGQEKYKKHSAKTSLVLDQLFESLKGEGLTMYTMKDFERDYFKRHFLKLTQKEKVEFVRLMTQGTSLEGVSPETLLAGLMRPKIRQTELTPEQEELLQTVPPEKRFAGLSDEKIRQYLEQRTAGRKTTTRKPRRKKEVKHRVSFLLSTHSPCFSTGAFSLRNFAIGTKSVSPLGILCPQPSSCRNSLG